MDFGIPLVTGQSVLVVHSRDDGTETKEILDYFDKFRSHVGPTGSVRIAALSELGINCTYFVIRYCQCYYVVTFIVLILLQFLFIQQFLFVLPGLVDPILFPALSTLQQSKKQYWHYVPSVIMSVLLVRND